MRRGALLGGVLAVALAPAAMAQSYKMTTPIAPGVATPNHLDSSIGPLDLEDGSPIPAAVEKIYDNLDRSRYRPICSLLPSSTRLGCATRRTSPDRTTRRV